MNWFFFVFLYIFVFIYSKVYRKISVYIYAYEGKLVFFLLIFISGIFFPVIALTLVFD